MIGKANVIEELNRLLEIEYRSFPMYLADASPWTTQHDESAAGALKNIVADQQAMSQRIGELIINLGGRIEPGEYPMQFTDTHFLSLEYLLKELLLLPASGRGRYRADRLPAHRAARGSRAGRRSLGLRAGSPGSDRGVASAASLTRKPVIYGPSPGDKPPRRGRRLSRPCSLLRRPRRLKGRSQLQAVTGPVRFHVCCFYSQRERRRAGIVRYARASGSRRVRRRSRRNDRASASRRRQNDSGRRRYGRQQCGLRGTGPATPGYLCGGRHPAELLRRRRRAIGTRY